MPCFPAENSKLYTRFAIYQCYRSNIKWILSKPRSGIFDGRKTKTLQTSVIYVSSTHSHANNVLPLHTVQKLNESFQNLLIEPLQNTEPPKKFLFSYREPYANFISANFITVNLSNISVNICLMQIFGYSFH